MSCLKVQTSLQALHHLRIWWLVYTLETEFEMLNWIIWAQKILLNDKVNCPLQVLKLRLFSTGQYHWSELLLISFSSLLPYLHSYY